MEYKRALVLSPHADDAELGCGGTISRMVAEGTEVFVAVFSIAEESVPPGAPRDTLQEEFYQSIAVLGVRPENRMVYGYKVRKFPYFRQEILEELVRMRTQINPELVLMPSGRDVHQDHQVIHAEGLRAFKNYSMLGYEMYWNQITFSAQVLISLKEDDIQHKWEALAKYKSQLDLKRPYFSRDAIESIARIRGIQAGTTWAEAFEAVRITW